MTTKAEALFSLYPNNDWVLYGEDLEWLDEKVTKPTDSEINAEINRLDIEYANTKYQRNRAAEYPSWQTQLDYIYHNGIDKWKTDIVDPVKAKYPKPE